MLDYLFEFIATFVFVFVILTVGQPIPIALTLLACIYLASAFSKGSINPAVSFGLVIRGDITITNAVGYIVAELLGAVAAVLMYKVYAAKTSAIVKI